MAYKMVKQFDCQDMPDDVRIAFFSNYDCTGNDCLVKWYFDEEDIADALDNEASNALVNSWLLENGAVPGDNIVIFHWW